MEPRSQQTLEQLVRHERQGRLIALAGTVFLAVGGCFAMGYTIVPVYQLIPSTAKYGEPLFRLLQTREAFTTWWYPMTTLGLLVLGGLGLGFGAAWLRGRLRASRWSGTASGCGMCG